MKKVILAGISAILFAAASGQAQSTAFTYQGQLRSGETPANGNYDLTFGLFTSASGPEQIGTIQTNSPLAILNGLFTVTLDFGSQFQGADRWLEISVRTNGGTEFATLTPRQKVTATPYALFASGAATAGAAGSATKLTGSLSGDVTGTQTATVVAAVGGQSAGNVAAGASAANAATSANTPETIVKRDETGGFAAGAITAVSVSGDGSNLTSLNASELKAGTISDARLSGNVAQRGADQVFTGANAFVGPLSATNGNNAFGGTLTGNVIGNATTANSFSGALSGDVAGTQGATMVVSVGGQSATAVASGSSAANAASSADTPGTLVKRDASGNFAAGAVTVASISGSGAGLTGLNGANLVSGSVGTAQLAGGSVTSNQLAGGAALANLNASGQSGVPSGGVILSSRYTDTNLINAGYVRLGTANLGETWQKRATAPIAGRFFNHAVWTGTEMIVWGGLNASGQLGDGARYNPGTDTWTPVSSVGAPHPNTTLQSVWTGTEMIVWGGVSNTTFYRSGGRYNPATDTWTPVSLVGAPEARANHSAIWTGTEMIVWGGFSNSTYYANGGRYNPSTDTWTPISTAGSPDARNSHAAVWTGTEMIFWGGYNPTSGPLRDGGRYRPATDSWVPFNQVGSPNPARQYLGAVWTGTEVIVWGGTDVNGTQEYANGGRYNPATDSWSSLPAENAPAGRYQFVNLWTGSEMIVWGGFGLNGRNDGARYNPTANSWTPIASTFAPGRYGGNMAVWTGGEMIVFGGRFYPEPHFNDTYSYVPPRRLSLYSKP